MAWIRRIERPQGRKVCQWKKMADAPVDEQKDGKRRRVNRDSLCSPLTIRLQTEPTETRCDTPAVGRIIPWTVPTGRVVDRRVRTGERAGMRRVADRRGRSDGARTRPLPSATTWHEGWWSGKPVDLENLRDELKDTLDNIKRGSEINERNTFLSFLSRDA